MSANLSKKIKDNAKSGNNNKMSSNMVNGSRFVILNGESTEETNVMTTQSCAGKQSKNPSKKVRAENSNRIPSKNQQSTATNKYLVRIPIEQPYL